MACVKGRIMEKHQKLADDYAFSKQLSSTTDNHIHALMVIEAALNGKYIGDCTEKDFEKAERHIRKAFAATGANNVRKSIMALIRWMEMDIYFIERINKRILKRVKVPATTIKADDLITAEEFSAVIKAAGSNLFWKTLLYVFRYTGARVSEILPCRIRDLRINKTVESGAIYAEIDIYTAKTRLPERPKRTIVFDEVVTPILIDWLNCLELRDNPEALLFPSPENPTLQLPKQYPNRMLKRLAEKAGTRKRMKNGKPTHIWPHLLRHTFITDIRDRGASDKLTIQIGGWRDGRQIPGYDALKPTKTNSQKQFLGLETDENGTNGHNKCPKCHNDNVVSAKFCNMCGYNLHQVKPIEELQDEINREKNVKSLVAAVLKDESKREALISLLEGQ